MIRKLCPYCLQSSYSAYDSPEWICPYCGKDIPTAVSSNDCLPLLKNNESEAPVIPFETKKKADYSKARGNLQL